MDETTLTPEPFLTRGWRKRGKGQQAHIPYPAGSRWAQHVFGGYNVMDDTVCYTLADKRDSEGFVAWLEHLVQVYPTQGIGVILDNASFHRSALVKAALALLGERVEFFYLPAHSPELNPIERFWLHLKEQVAGNRMCTEQTVLVERLHRQLASQNDPASPSRFQLCH